MAGLLDQMRSFQMRIHDHKVCPTDGSRHECPVKHPSVVYVSRSQFRELADCGLIDVVGKWTGKAREMLRREVPTCEWVGIGGEGIWSSVNAAGTSTSSS